MSDEKQDGFTLVMPTQAYDPERRILIAEQAVGLKTALHVAVAEYTKLLVARGQKIEPFAIGAALYIIARGVEEQFKEDPNDVRPEQCYAGFFDMYSANNDKVQKLAADMRLLKMEPLGSA